MHKETTMKRFELYGKLEYISPKDLSKDWKYLGMWEDFIGIPWRIYKHKVTKEIRYTEF